MSALADKLVLITGAAGRIGQVLRLAFAKRYRLRLLDLTPIADAPDALVGDMNDAALLDRAMAGVDAVVHLAGDPRPGADFTSLLEANIRGVYSVYEAARRHGVKRVVFASTNHTVENYSPLRVPPPWTELQRYPVPLPFSPSVPVRADSPYGASKAWGEALASYYADRHGISSVCLRLGAVTPAPDDPSLGQPRAWALWMSTRDLIELFHRAVEADGVGCAIVYGCSMNTRRWWDLTHARELIGFVPQDDSETMIPQWYRAGPVPPAPAYPLPWGERLAALPAHDGRALLVWIGQAGFFLKLPDGLKIVIDPFLTGWHDRMQAPLLPACDLPADLVLITHTHRDHLDVHALPVIAQCRPQARFIAPPTGRDRLVELSIAPERVVTLVPGESHVVGGATLTAVRARHQDTAPDAQGYVIRTPLLSLYHTGDSEYDPCLLAAREYQPDILLLPVNGRGGNMSGEQAARLAADLAPRGVIPMHYGCLRKPDEEPMELLDRFLTALSHAAPHVKPLVMEHGAILSLP